MCLSECVFWHEAFIGNFWRKKTSPEAGFFSPKEISSLALQQQELQRGLQRQERELQRQERQQERELQQRELQQEQQLQ